MSYGIFGVFWRAVGCLFCVFGRKKSLCHNEKQHVPLFRTIDGTVTIAHPCHDNNIFWAIFPHYWLTVRWSCLTGSFTTQSARKVDSIFIDFSWTNVKLANEIRCMTTHPNNVWIPLLAIIDQPVTRGWPSSLYGMITITPTLTAIFITHVDIHQRFRQKWGFTQSRL